MTICYFGFYDAGYSRNRILIKGLKLNGVKVIECHSDKAKLAKYYDLIKKYFKIKNKFDVMIVGFPGFLSMFLAKIITRKPIIFDAFLSLYDSNVFDRKVYPARSLKAVRDWLFDYFSCRLADKILIDTNEHIDYFIREYRVNKKKIFRIFVGSDKDYFKPSTKVKKDGFIVHFHGMGVPLQGAEYIIKTARLLKNEDVYFNIIGTKVKIMHGDPSLKKVTYIENIPYDKINGFLSLADIGLGIFGNTPKASRVIPNKIFELLAARVPIITAETPAVKELLEDKKNVIFCQAANEKDLADKIMMLKNNQELRKQIATNGYNLFISKLTPYHLGMELINIINK